MKKLLSIFIIISVISVIGVVFLVIWLSSIVNENHDSVIIQPYVLEIQNKDKQIKQFREQIENIIKIKNYYRDYTAEIVELATEKKSAIGTSTNDSIPESDEVLLLMFKNTVLDMKDDLKLYNEVKEYLISRKETLDNAPFIWPVKGGVPKITSSYGFRKNSELHPGEEGIHLHGGLDIKGNYGDDIIATANGTVKFFNYEDPILGRMVMIEHKYGLVTVYGHLSQIMVRRMGQKIKRGEIIGKMGSTGYSTGVHLHYEIRKDRVTLDPLIFLSNF